MNLANINKQATTFCAISLLFLGSLYYFVSVAFKDATILETKQSVSQDYLKDL